MDKELKAKWVEALRSGRYQQAREVLYDGNGYCCLGVLLCVWGGGEWQDDHNYFYADGGFEEELEGDLGKLSGVLLGDGVPEGRLIELNDGNTAKGLEQQPFSVIADYIEKHL